jgi:hypothetical protein
MTWRSFEPVVHTPRNDSDEYYTFLTAVLWICNKPHIAAFGSLGERRLREYEAQLMKFREAELCKHLVASSLKDKQLNSTTKDCAKTRQNLIMLKYEYD